MNILLLSFSLLFASSQQVEIFETDIDNLKLSHELIYGHPGLISGDYDAYVSDLLTAIEINHDSVLLNEACMMLSSFGGNNLSSARLARLIELLHNGIASDYIINAFNNGLSASRFSIPLRPLFAEDMHSSWISSWYVQNNLGEFGWTNALDQKIDLPTRENVSEWQQISRRPHSKACLPTQNALQQHGYGVAVTYFKAKSGLGLLNVYCDEAAQLWLNGTEILGHRELDTFNRQNELLHQLPIAEGWNELVVCYANNSNPLIGARVLDGAGNILPTSEWSDSKSFPMIPHRASFSTALVSKFPPSIGTDAFDKIREVFLHTNLGLIDDAMLVAKPQEMNTHEKLAWLLAQFITLDKIYYYPDSIKRQLLADIFSEIEASGYYIDKAYLSETSRLLKENKNEYAVALCQRIFESLPDNQRVRVLCAISKLPFDPTYSLINNELEQLVIDYPNDPNAWELLIRQADNAGNAPRLVELLEQRLQSTGIGAQIVIENLLRGSQTQQSRAFAMIERLLAERPDSTVGIALLDKWYRLADDFTAIATTSKSKSDSYPLSHDRALASAAAFYRADQLSEAKALLARATKLSPSSTNGINWQRQLNLNPDCDSFFSDFAPDDIAALATRSSDDVNSEFATSLLLDSTLYYVFSDNGYIQQTHTLTQINNQQGALSSGTQPVLGTPIHMRVIKPDGSIYEAHQVDDSWELPTLEPGDVIDSKFEFSASGAFGIAAQLGRFRMQAFNQPYALSRAVYYIDNEALGEFVVKNFDDEKIIENYQTGSVHVFENRDATGLSMEEFMPDTSTLLPNVSFGSSSDLAIRANHLYDLMVKITECPADIEEKLRQWLNQMDLQGSEQQRATVIYNEVQNLISEFTGYNNIIDTFLTTRGLPIGLLSKLFELNGIAHEWAFIKQQAEHLNLSRPAFYHGKDYKVPALRLPPTIAGEQPLWVMCIEHHAPIGMAKPAMYGAEAIIVSYDSYRLEIFDSGSPFDMSDIIADINFHILDDGSAQISGEVHVLTMDGANMRRQIEQVSPDQINKFKLSFAGTFVDGIDVTSGDFYQPNQDVDDHLLHYSFSGSIPDFVQAHGDRLGARPRFPSFAEMHKDLGKAERKFDFVYPLRKSAEFNIQITTDGGYTLAYGPEPRSESIDGFDYSISIEKSARQINIQSTTNIDGVHLSKDQFPDFLNLLQDIEKQEKRMIEFIRVAAAETATVPE